MKKLEGISALFQGGTFPQTSFGGIVGALIEHDGERLINSGADVCVVQSGAVAALKLIANGIDDAGAFSEFQRQEIGEALLMLAAVLDFSIRANNAISFAETRKAFLSCSGAPSGAADAGEA